MRQSYDNIGGYIGHKFGENSKERSPGPAEYFPSIYKSHQGWTFGSKTNDKFEVYDSPGPGYYEAYRNNMYALGKFGKERRGKIYSSYDSPGPGHYSPKSKSKDGWTIQGKRSEKYFSGDVPGPGEYYPFYNQGTPAYSMAGKNKKKKKASDGPGPDTYFPSINATKPRPKSAKFTSGRKDRRGHDQPGPGQYDMRSMLGGPSASIKGRPKTAKKKSSHPGPGQYKDKYKITKPRAASAKIGKAKRMAHYTDDTPGPGFYNNWDRKDLRGTKFGSSKRPGTAKKKSGPGPGSYNIKSTFGGKSGKTIAGKRKHKSIEDTPGPGMYNPKLDKGPAFS